MKSDIWMPLYIGDYTGDTIGLTLAEHGAYLLSMMAYWRNRGPLTRQDLEGICNSHCDRICQYYVTETVDGASFYRHPRLDREIELANHRKQAQKLRTESARAALSKIRTEKKHPKNTVANSVTDNVTASAAMTVTESSSPSPSPSVQECTPLIPFDEKTESEDKELLAEQIYNAYPLKVGKPAAIKAILRAMKDFKWKLLLEKTKQYAVARKHNLEFTPHPSTWFNQQRFNDDPSTWVKQKPTMSMADLRRLKDQLEHEIWENPGGNEKSGFYNIQRITEESAAALRKLVEKLSLVEDQIKNSIS